MRLPDDSGGDGQMIDFSDIDVAKIDPKEYKGKVLIVRVPGNFSVREMVKLRDALESAFEGCKRAIVIPKNMHLLFTDEVVDLEKLGGEG